MNTDRAFARDFRVRVDDINYGGHMGNERALVLFQDARLSFLESIGFSERDIGGGAGVILVEARVEYVKEVRLHDELVTEVAVSSVRRSSFDVLFRTARRSDSAWVLRGSTRMLSFDYASRKVKSIPEAFRSALAVHVVGEEWAGMRGTGGA